MLRSPALFLVLPLAIGLGSDAALAQKGQPPAPQQSRSSPLGGLGSNSKEPIKIDADRLDIFDREKRATFSGNVVAVQGETTMRCTVLHVFYEQSATAQAEGQTPAPAQATTPTSAHANGQAGGQPNGGAAGDSNIRKLDCKGPVTVVSKDQTATGDNATYDKGESRVVLTGHVALSQGGNVQQCDRVVYNLETSIAHCESKPGGRVQGVFVPGSGNPGEAPAKPKPRSAPRTN